MQPVSWLGQGIMSHDQWQLHRGRHGLVVSLHDKLDWASRKAQQLVATGVNWNMVRHVIENLVRLTGMVARSTKRSAAGNAFAKKPLGAWTVICLAIAQYPAFDRSRCHYSGEALSKFRFIQGVKKLMHLLKPRRIHGRTSYPSLHLSWWCQSLWCPCRPVAGGKPMVIFTGLSSNKSKH